MSKFYIGIAGTSLVAKSKDIFHAIKIIKELRLNALEVEFVKGIWMSSELAEKVGSYAKRLGIRLSVHAPYYINLCSEDKSKIEASKDRILKCVERANELNSNIVVIHTAYYGTYGPTRCYELIKKSLIDLETRIRRSRIENVKLGIEVTAKKSQFGDLDEVIRICREVDIATPCIDWAHIFIRNNGKIDYGYVIDRVVNELELNHLHTHFTGVKYDNVKREYVDVHEPINNTPPFKPFIQEVLKRNIEVTIICESPLLEKDALKMKRIIESTVRAYNLD